jgi:hypothetical protein
MQGIMHWLQHRWKILAMADVFEALTAADRPYKSAKTMSESLKIMARMCQDNHLDGELFIYFLTRRLWLDYAREFIPPAQIDAVDLEKLVRIASGKNLH